MLSLFYLFYEFIIFQLPLESDTCDYCIFCLSLMGTNVAEYLREANRILKVGGTLVIAEIRSRIVSMKKFMQALTCMGFAPPQREVCVFC